MIDPARNEIMSVLPQRSHKSRNISWAVMAGLIAAAFVWSHWAIVRDLFAFWQDNQDYSSGQFVPLLALYVVWSNRTVLARLPLGMCWMGLALFVVGQCVRFYGIYDMYGSLQRYSLVLSAIGVAWFLLGTPFVLRFKWVLLLLFLAIPLPGRIHNAVSIPLQDFATRSAVFGLELIGQLVVCEGNVLRVSEQNTVAVAEACNGLRMLNAFIVVAVALAFLVQRPRWQKAWVVGSAIPIAVLSNTIRLVVTVLLFEYVGSKTAEQFFHDFAGVTMMPLAVAAIILELKLLNWIAGGTGDVKHRCELRRVQPIPCRSKAGSMSVVVVESK